MTTTRLDARVRNFCWVAFAGLALTLASTVSAKPPWINDFNSVYGTAGTRLDTCGLCHNNFGSGSRNPYGNAFKDAGGDDNPAAAFAAIEGDFSDSDSANNLDEIVALFMPGYSCDNIGDTSNAPADLADYVDMAMPGCVAAPDTDGDTIADNLDNCTLVANTDQLDTDGDSIGNICDGDFNEDCEVNFIDLSQMKASFFGSDPGNGTDMTGDGQVNFPDLSRLKAVFFLPPGPSGVPNACTR